ncbi:hypothetical protein ADK60_15880 [Streptomyces sp. XY431]|nr:hypothetical protein ADK60_15880 [Streptomyces sp. XY431]
MGWILLIVLVVGGTVLGVMLRCPGGRRYAFGPDCTGQRQDLDAARGRLRCLERAAGFVVWSARRASWSGARGGLRGLERAAGRERDAARAEVEAAKRARRDRVGRARAHLARPKDLGRGVSKSSLGDSLRLYEHALGVRVDGRTVEDPLSEVSVLDDCSGKDARIDVALPDGRRQMVTVSPEETPESEVRKFVIEVFNAVADAKVSRAERPARVPEVEAEAERRDRGHRRPRGSPGRPGRWWRGQPGYGAGGAARSSVRRPRRGVARGRGPWSWPVGGGAAPPVQLPAAIRP